MANPPITDNDLSEWRVEATAERRRTGLKNPHSFRVQVLVDEVRELRAAAEREAKLLEEQRARTASAETREKHLAEVRDRQRAQLADKLAGVVEDRLGEIQGSREDAKTRLVELVLAKFAPHLAYTAPDSGSLKLCTCCGFSSWTEAEITHEDWCVYRLALVAAGKPAGNRFGSELPDTDVNSAGAAMASIQRQRAESAGQAADRRMRWLLAFGGKDHAGVVPNSGGCGYWVDQPCTCGAETHNAALVSRMAKAGAVVEEIAALFHNRESAKNEKVARVELAKVALIIMASGLLPPGATPAPPKLEDCPFCLGGRRGTTCEDCCGAGVLEVK